MTDKYGLGSKKKIDWKQAHKNKILNQFQKQVIDSKLPLDDITYYNQQIAEVNRQVSDNPDILDKYHLPTHLNFKSFDTGMAHIGKADKKGLKDKLIFYRANPWMMAKDVIGRDVIANVMSTGTPFRSFTPAQRVFLRDFLDPREQFSEIVLSCCRGGSKTFLAGVGMVIATMLIPRVRITVIAGSGDQSTRLYSEYYKPFLKESVVNKLVFGNIRKKSTDFKHYGWTKCLTSSVAAVRGPRPDIIVFDEVTSIEQEVINEALGGIWTASDIKIIYASTPNEGHMYFTSLFNESGNRVKGKEIMDIEDAMDDSENGMLLYNWGCYDIDWITEKAIQKAKEHYTKQEFKIYMLGMPASTQSSVYNSEMIERQCVDLPEPVKKYALEPSLENRNAADIQETSIGVDWGIRHKAVMVVAGKDSKNNVYILHVFGESGLEMQKFRAYIADKAKEYMVNTIMCDSENLAQIQELKNEMYASGIGITPMSFAFNKYKYVGINILQFRLEKANVFFDRDLKYIPMMIKQLKDYKYKETPQEGIKKQTVKKNDDFCDALNMAVFPMYRESSSGESREIQKISVSTRHNSRRGSKQLLRKKKLYRGG